MRKMEESKQRSKVDVNENEKKRERKKKLTVTDEGKKENVVQDPVFEAKTTIIWWVEKLVKICLRGVAAEEKRGFLV